jgi:AraC-like DNA-binding protein
MFRNEIINHNIESIKSSYNSINEATYSMLEAQTKINSSNRINAVAQKSRIDRDLQYELYEVSKEIETIISGNSYNAFLYFPRIDHVVSKDAITSMGIFYNAYMKDTIKMEEFSQAISSAYDSNTYILRDNQSNIIFYNKLQNGCTVFFLMYNTYLRNIVSRNDLTDGGTLYIYDSHNSLLFSSNDDNPGNMDGLLGSQSGVVSKVRVNKTSMTAIIIHANSLRYLFLIPESFFFQKLLSVNITLALSIILTLILGILSMMLLLNVNYRPLGKIMENYTEYTGDNEFYAITGIIEAMAKKEKELEMFFANSKNVLQDSTIINLLTGSAPQSIPIIQEAGFQDDSPFVVVAISIESYGELSTEPGREEDAHKTACYIVSNILLDEIGAYGKVFITELDENLVCVVLVDDEMKKNAPLHIYRCLEKAHSRAMGTFSISFYAGIGDVKAGYDSVITGYKEALEALEYKYLVQTDDVISYRQIKSNESVKYYYSQEKEQQFANIIRTGDFQAANEYMLKAIDEQTKHKQISPNIIKCFIFDLLGTILKTSVNVTGEDIFVNNSKDIDSVFSANKISDITANLQRILRVVCKDISFRSAPSARHVDLKNFIDNHYQDQHLNINMIGDYFGLAPSYVSKMFKENYRESMLDYINKLRVKKAQELLVTTNHNIDEIGSMVGLANKVTFIRVFKKHTGLTPSKFRELEASKRANNVHPV